MLLAMVLLAGSVGPAADAAHTTGVSSVTTPFGGTVVHIGNEWHLWMPSNHSTGTSGTVNVFANNSSNTIAVGGSGLQASGSSFTVNFNSGSTINVCAPGAAFPFDGSHCDFNEDLDFQKTFTGDADLGMILVDGNQISSSFTEFSTSGTEITVPGTKSSIVVSAVPVDSNGESYKVNGSSAGPQTVNLNAKGVDTTVTVTGVANNAATQNYTFVVHRGLANADLSNLTISPGSISGFSSSTLGYQTMVSSATHEVTVTPTTSDANASFQLKVGAGVVTNPVQLNDATSDPTTIDVVVTSDNTLVTKTYSIAVSHIASIGLHAAFTGTGGGTVTSTDPDTNLDCASTAPAAAGCTASYDDGSSVTLHEAPATGSFFNGWSGVCSGSGSDTSFTMPSSTATCTAKFDTLGPKQTGTTLKVTTGADDAGAADQNCYTGRCTLRDALASVPASGTITFADGVSTVALDDGVAYNHAGKSATINGGGDVTIDGSSLCCAASLGLEQGTLAINALTLSGNNGGGGINTAGGTSLTLTNVELSGNGTEGGGGIFAGGTLTMTGGSIHDGGAFGGGGLLVEATATLTGVDITGNSAQVGGGVYVDSPGKLTLNGGVVAGNQSDSGGGIFVGGKLTVNGTLIAGNASGQGAGVFVASEAGSTATFTNATFLENTGDWALTADGPAVAKLVNSTIVGNQGGIRGTGASFLNTLFAFNNSMDCDAPNEPTSLGHNVADDGTCWTTPATGDLQVGDAGVGPPTSDGFVPLVNGSPALDAGTKTAAGGLTVPTKDALGTVRPQGPGVDVGALEMQVHKLTVKIAGPGTGTVDPPSGSYVAGSTVHLTATATGGASFASWSGACSGTDVSTDVVMSADETCTAQFAKPPAITAFAPKSGRIRSTITLTGSGFTGATSVTVGGHDAVFKVTGDTKIAVTVPDDVNTPDNLIKVTGPAGDITVGPWTLVWVKPTIGSFTPAKAGGGKTVTVTGTGFLGAFAADFHGQDVTPTVISDTKITLVVPATPDSTGLISITTPGDTATSKTPFTFIPLPVVDDPSSAAIGATILITGANFTGATAVTIGGVAAKFKLVNGASIQLVVPDHLTDGPIAVTTPGGTGASAGNFVHSLLTPVITSFTPIKGPIRSTVTLTGSHFRGSTELSFGGHDATDWTIVSDTKITAKVPDSAGTGKLALTNIAGTGLSSLNFTVSWAKPTISSFTPLTGPTGTTVTINGTGFLGTTSVKFSGVAATDVTVVSATKITVIVPDGAITGKVTVTTPGGTAISVKNYNVS